jgi:hypothetical protein
MIRSPADAAQAQLEAYNAKDLQRFLDVFADDVREFRPPETEPFLIGREAFAEYYGSQRFTLPGLHAEVLERMVVGTIVVDHERISGIRTEPVEGVAVYEVVDGRIRSVWFHSDE